MEAAEVLEVFQWLNNNGLPKDKIDQFPVTLPIKKIIQETKLIRSYIFEYPLKAKPGQFVNVWIPGVDEKPFGVADQDAKTFMLTISKVGPFSCKMHELKVGDKVGVRGPYGQGFKFKKGDRIAMVAGGYGVAPLHFAAKEAGKTDAKVDFILGARSEGQLVFVDRLEKLKNVKLHLATDDGSAGFKGFTTEVLVDLLKKQKFDEIFAVGPEIMMKKTFELAEKHKIHVQMSLERYMKCGFGVCGQCCVDDEGLCVCKDGPVFGSETLRKIKEFGKYHRDKVGRKVEV